MTRDRSLNFPKNTSSQHVVYKYCFESQNKQKYTTYCELVFFLSMNNLLSYCGLTDARMRASENLWNLCKAEVLTSCFFNIYHIYDARKSLGCEVNHVTIPNQI